jgi:hypothetical protein
MGKLDKTRMTDATKVSKVDDVHNATEQDAGEIFGIPDNTQITSPIFGETPSGGKSVQPDGSIRGNPLFKMSAPTSDPASAIGFEFKDGTKTKRLVMTDSQLVIWNWTGTTWEKVTDVENPGGTFLALSDVSDTAYTGKAGYLVKVNSGATGIELVAPTAGSGVTTFIGLTDTPGAMGTVGQIVTVQDASNLKFSDPPSGIGDPFVMWLEAVGKAAGWGNGGWTDAYNWAFTTVADDGGFLTDNTALLTNDGLKANKFITLAAGVYEISLWYYTSTFDKTGVRNFRISNATGYTDAVGPATVGCEEPGHFYFNTGTSAAALDGIHHLGTRQLIMKAGPSKIKVEVKQTSTGNLMGVTFFMSIAKVK